MIQAKVTGSLLKFVLKTIRLDNGAESPADLVVNKN